MSKLILPVGKRDHLRGPKDARVTLVEYGDFECPFCGEAYGDLKVIGERMGSRLCFVFREFPITTAHPNAEAAALAAEAAGAQGRFWQMHDCLYENQDALEPENLVEYGRSLDLDMRRFIDDLKTGRFLPKVKEDFMSGVRSGVNGTPGLFINGNRYEGSYVLADLLPALEHAAAARTSHPA
jgi:protein-disulfide isomerase